MSEVSLNVELRVSEWPPPVVSSSTQHPSLGSSTNFDSVAWVLQCEDLILGADRLRASELLHFHNSGGA